MITQYISHSPSQTRELAGLLAPNLSSGLCVLLYGPLGSGKTEFVRGIASSLGFTAVRSPSFTLLNEYHTPSGQIILHADLYRLDNAAELGLEDYDDAILLVEWPENWHQAPTDERIAITFKPLSETEREITISARGPRSEKAVSGL